MFWITAALAGVPTHTAMESAEWSEVTTKNHADAGSVKVWRTSLAGVECFKGTATTDVAAAKLLTVVADVEGAVKWSSAGVTEGKMLSNKGGRLEYYQYLDVPGWTMASDRFWFLYSTVEDQDGKVAFRWNRLEGGGEHAAVFDKVKSEHPQAVEPPVNVGGWYFETKSDGTHISYAICSDTGGSIPAAVQNAATKKTLPDTLGDVVREARKR